MKDVHYSIFAENDRLLKALLNIRKYGPRNYGICYHIPPNVPNATFLSICKKWEKFSGDERFPVPSITPGRSAETEYHTRTNLWAGEYGKLRYELLDFVINYLEGHKDEG